MNAGRRGGGDVREDIAIVGMSCLFPGADTVSRYWHNIVHKVDCITDAPPDWQPELFFDPEGEDTDRSYTQKGGFLGDVSRFDPTRYGVVPRSVYAQVARFREAGVAVPSQDTHPREGGRQKLRAAIRAAIVGNDNFAWGPMRVQSLKDGGEILLQQALPVPVRNHYADRRQRRARQIRLHVNPGDSQA